MKTTFFLTVAILLLSVSGNVSCQEVASKNKTVQQGEATITCTPDLYELTSKWVSEYNHLNPGNSFKVISASYNNQAFGTAENLSFISTKSQTAINNQDSWKMVVGRGIVVPIINAGNPFLSEIEKKGVSREQFEQIFNKPDKQEWGNLIAGSGNASIHLFVVNDESVKASMGEFLQLNKIQGSGITFGSKDEVISAVQKDPLAVGFCKISDIMVPGNPNLAENIKMLPIDKNGNGTIDYMEDIYADANVFLRGVWIGKYPKTLCSNIYVVSKAAPVNETELAFLNWVLTDGQQYMVPNGFSELAGSESQAQLSKINTVVISDVPVEKASHAGLILLVIALVILSGLIVSAMVRKNRKQKIEVPGLSMPLESFSEESVDLPQGLYFDKSHTWAFMEKDGNISIGIDDFLQHITGPITRIEMKNPGEKINKGDLLFSVIQSGKQLNLYSPVSGTIKKQNEKLNEDSSYLNSSPYSEGWVYMIEPTNWSKDIQFMDMAQKYKNWIDNEFSRIKDFLAATLKPESPEYSHLVLQDGGVLKDGVLTDFGPEVWEDFQINFLDNYK